MISSIFVWLLIAVDSAAVGFALVSLIRTHAAPNINKTSNVETNLFGFVVLITLASYLSIFFSLSSIFAIGVAVLALFYFLVKRPGIQISKPNALILGLFLLITLFALETATRRPSNSDTNLYHAQAIHWIESYPAVFGLGNLHGRLAFNSVWLIANAFFSFSDLFGRSLHLVSGFYFALFGLVLGLSINKQKNFKVPLTGILLLFAAFQYLASDISSPGTDVPATLTLWLVFFLSLAYSKEDEPLTPVLITALSAFAVVIKLSSIVILLIPMIHLLRAFRAKDNRTIITILTTVGLVTLPYFVRNIIQSGYLIYPLPAIDLFNFAWKVPPERVIEERDAILVWGRLPKLPIKEVLSMPFWAWLPQWFEGLTITRKVIVVIAALSPVFFAFNNFIFRINDRHRTLHVTYMIGVYFWLFSSPDFRFGYGFLIPALIMNLLPNTLWFADHLKFNKVRTVNILTVALILFIGVAFVRSIELSSLTDRLLLPRDYDRVKTQECAVDGIQIFCAVEYNACSYHNFPCVPKQRGWVKLLGDGIEDGFYGEK